MSLKLFQCVSEFGHGACKTSQRNSNEKQRRVSVWVRILSAAVMVV